MQRLQELVVNYKDTVLNAQREVEDAMVAFTRSKEEERCSERQRHCSPTIGRIIFAAI